MTKEERMAKSEKARSKRKTVKEIKAKVLRHYYAHMHRLRIKYQTIRGRHHEDGGQQPYDKYKVEYRDGDNT